MTAVSKSVYFDVLNDIVDKYNITYHRINKIKPVDVKSHFCPEYSVDSTDKDPKFKIGDLVRISKYKNIFTKGYAPNYSGEVFVLSKIENTVPWSYVISDLNGGKVVGTFYEKRIAKG